MVPDIPWSRTLPTLLLALLLWLAYFLILWDKIRLAAFIFIYAVSLVVFITILFNGGIMAPAVYAIFFLLISSALLSSSRFYWSFLAFINIFILLVYFLQINAILPVPEEASLSTYLLVILTLFTIVMIMMDSAVKILYRSILVNKRQRQELVEKEHYTRTILDAVEDYIIVIDNYGSILRMNHSAEQFCEQYLPHEILSARVFRDCFNLSFPNGHQYIMPHSRQIKIHRVPLLLQKGSTKVPVILFGKALASSPEDNSLVITLRDMTSEKDLEEQLLHSQKLEAMGQLSSGVAHDFNNMLGGILIAADQLEECVSEENREMVKIIQSAGERAAKLTRQLLDFSRKGAMVSTTVDIHKILKDTTEMLRQLLEKSIRMEVHLNARAYIIVGDETQIMNSVVNMAINAAHAMEGKGTLEIRTEDAYLDQAFCSISGNQLLPGDFLKLDIGDTGIGMTKELQEKIFEPFFTTREKGEGTGLGLSAVKRMVMNHRGLLTVDSEPGKGTVFHMYFPVSLSEEIQDIEKRDRIDGTGKTILLVDDDDLIRVTAKVILESMQFHVLLAERGEDVLDMIANTKVDLLIIDMIMPGISGRQVFEWVHMKYPDIPVFLSSGFFDKEDVQDMEERGLKGFIRKPFLKKDIHNQLKKIWQFQ